MQSTQVSTDAVVMRALTNADGVTDTGLGGATSYAGRATELLHAQHDGPEPTPALSDISCRGRLAEWQIQKVYAYVEQHLDSGIRIATLAKLIRLSPSYFPVTFKQTFGETPHAYLTRRRIERAQKLMLTTNLLLGQIALDCGFCDQGHFCRVFLRQVGVPPLRWRRQRAAMVRGANATVEAG